MATTLPQKQQVPLAEEVQSTIKRLEAKDPGLKQLLKKSYAYAIFPNVGKAGLVIGGSYGRGAVYEKGKLVGYATIGQTTIGVQVGGITFTEVLAFENRQAFNRFKQGGLKFAAGAAAVLVKAGAAGQADYEKGVIALAYSRGGMLLEAAIGGQKFKFKPKDGDQSASGGGTEGKATRSKDRGADDDSNASDDSDEETDGATGLAGRTLESVRDAASGVSDLVKRHPWASAAVGTAAVTGVALLVVRSMRQAGSDASADEDSDDESDADSDRAEDQADEDDQDDENADEEGASNEADEGEDDNSDESAEDAEDEDASPRRSRSRSGGRARSR